MSPRAYPVDGLAVVCRKCSGRVVGIAYDDAQAAGMQAKHEAEAHDGPVPSQRGAKA